MKLLRVLIRMERESAVVRSLESGGFYGLTKTMVMGRGQQQGIQVGDVSYDVLSKQMLLLAVSDVELEKAIRLIEQAAYTGHPGDGKIFVQEILECHTIRTGAQEHDL
ncbi:MAG: P-II family nitrogen regulator [Leptospirales bacterium]